MDISPATNAIANIAVAIGLLVLVNCQGESNAPRNYSPVKTSAAPGTPTAQSEKTKIPTPSSQNDVGDCTNLALAAVAVSYDINIAPFLKANCTTSGCHAKGAHDPDLTTYSKAKSEGAASFAAIEGGSMPPAKKLATKDKDLFKAWLDGGAMENSLSPSPSPSPSSTATKKPSSTSNGSATPISPCNTFDEDENRASTASTPTALVTYDIEIKALLGKYCTSCHGSGGTSPNLTSYDKARASGAKSGKEIQLGSMPPPKSKIKMTDAEKTLYATWVDEGYLQNASDAP